MSRSYRDTQIDAAADAYLEWRERCAAVDEAYRRWSTAAADARALAFAIYVAALDREERASNEYGRVVARNSSLFAALRATRRGEAA
jgi:hypothetical protein